MKNVLVFADDLTGAAEIAGIGYRHGLPTRLLRDPILQTRIEPGLTVLDTDSRLLPPHDAARAVQRFIAGLNPSDFDLIYKKTDSVMRGPLLAEIQALMSALGKSAALLLPQNPSRGRIIRDGKYLIDGVPLNKTAFADDPDYPARTSNVLELLGGPACCLTPHQDVPRSGIAIGQASSADDVNYWASVISNQILPAGGADFFQAILTHRALKPAQTFLNRLPQGITLLVSGSASACSRQFLTQVEQHGEAVFDISADPKDVCSALAKGSRAILAIRRPTDRAPGASLRLLSLLSQAVAAVLDRQNVTNLLIEGGATASAICRLMGWTQFIILGELAPGVVQMKPQKHSELNLVVKPGSYPWPHAVWV